MGFLLAGILTEVQVDKFGEHAGEEAHEEGHGEVGEERGQEQGAQPWQPGALGPARKALVSTSLPSQGIWGAAEQPPQSQSQP